MGKHVDADRTLTLTETLTLTITLTLTLFSHCVIHRQHFTGGRNHWVKRLVREVVGSNLNGRYFVIYLSVSMDRCQVRVRVRIRRVDQNGTASGNCSCCSAVRHRQSSSAAYRL